MKTFWGVNWKNGMKINNSHFIKERAHQAFLNSLLLRANLANYKYGISFQNGFEGLNYQIYNNRFSIDSCFGISRCGFLFYIDNESNKNIESLQIDKIRSECKADDIVQIYLKSDLEDVNEFGTIDSESFPASFPNSTFKYSLIYHTVTSNEHPPEIDELLPIAQLKVNQDGIEEIANYIPPSMTMSANEHLLKKHSELNQINFRLAKNISLTLQKLSKNAHQSIVVSNLINLADRLVFFFAENLDAFNSVYLDQSPIETYLFYKKINRIINAALANMSNRSEMVNLMASWAEIPSENFLDSLNEIVATEYSHMNLNRNFNSILSFVTIVDQLFSKTPEINI